MKKLITAGGMAVGLLLLIYGAGAFYFSSHTYPNTTFGQVGAGNLTREELKEKINNADTIDITLREGNGTSVIKSEEIGYDRTYKDEYIRWNQDSWAWPLEIFSKNEIPDIPFTVTYDKDLLKKEVESSSVYKDTVRTPSEDAIIAEGDSSFIIKGEVYGNEPVPEKYLETVEKGLEEGISDISISASKPYVQPKVTSNSPELQKELETRNLWAGTDIKLKVDDEVVPFIDWRNTYGLETSETEGFAEYNDKKFYEIADILAEKYNTVNTRRTFKNSLGQTIKLDPGTYGWSVDKDTFVQRLNETVGRGVVSEVSLPFTGSANGPASNDIGNSYIEIDLSTQYLWMYLNGELVLETPIVSGLLVEGRETPTGVYYVMDKYQGAILSGADYSQPVDFWVPFTDEGHGLHDANWVAEFGGDYYTYAGSHGCINLPVSIAPQLFGMAEHGMPVILYKSYSAEVVDDAEESKDGISETKETNSETQETTSEEAVTEE